MPRQAATTGSLPRAFEGVKEMQAGRSGPPAPANGGCEVRRRTRPAGTFRDRTSTGRILHAVLIHEDRSRGIGTPVFLTHDSRRCRFER